MKRAALQNILRFPSMLKKRNALWKVALLEGLLLDREKILDFGCGDLSLAAVIKETYPNTNVTGIDVINVKKTTKKISFVYYDGKKMPFKANSFDTVISFYVFHHCVDAQTALKECIRVAKRRVIVVEAIPRNFLEIFPMKVLDFFYNVWKLTGVPFADQFFTIDDWKKMIKRNGGSIKKLEEKKTIFSLIPIGKTYIFEIYKNEKR